MTARFATLVDAATILANVNAWRDDLINADVYDAEGLAGLTAAQVADRIGGRVVIETLTGSVAAYILGDQIPTYIDGKPAVRLSEILANPAIPVNQRLTALAATMNDLATLLRAAGASRFVAETFDDSRMWLALQTLIGQGKIPPINTLGDAIRIRPNGISGRVLFLEWPL